MLLVGGGKTGSPWRRATARICACCVAAQWRSRDGKPQGGASCVVCSVRVHGTLRCVSTANISKKNANAKTCYGLLTNNARLLILQKAAFRIAKGRLLRCKRPSFAFRKAAYCKMLDSQGVTGWPPPALFSSVWNGVERDMCLCKRLVHIVLLICNISYVKISSDPHILGFLASLWPRQAVRGGVWRRFRQLVHCLSKGKRFPVFRFLSEAVRLHYAWKSDVRRLIVNVLL